VPELPEVESVRRQLAPLVVGRAITEGWGHPSPKFAAAPLAAGPAIHHVGRRGKYLLLALDDDREQIVHLGMTGQLRLRPDGVDPYVRAWWALDDGGVLELRDVRRFGRVCVVRAGEYSSLPTLAGQGPEPWDRALDDGGLWRNLKRSSVRIKTQLLSQRPLAGVGNIYADEALWRAGVHPARRSITRRQADRLLQELRVVLEQGIANGGTTLRDYRAPDGQPGRNQLELGCYGQAGQPCARCGTELRRSVVDARGTTHCPTCQPRR
jgi:formamidopyrimidine-DNA glycosylase